MRSWVLAAGLLAAAFSSGAQAADLDEGPPPPRFGAPYDDPRYSDIYKYPKPPGYVVPAPPPYAGPPIPRERIYRDDDGPDYAGPRRYSYGDPAYGRRCVPRELVKDRLHHEGWRDFHDGEARGDIATVRARRPSGRLFELTLDRCSGEIVRAEPLEGRAYGPYAYGAPPRRWERFY
jgi:hypothetical protein